MRRLLSALTALGVVTTLAGSTQAHAQYAIRSGFSQTPVDRGDDIYRASDFGFDVNFYGVVSNMAVVCMNGYAILGFLAPSGPACAYPAALSGSSAPNISGLRTFYGSLLAPYFVDVNTAFAGTPGGQLYFGTKPGAWAATWNDVAIYNAAGSAFGGFARFQLALFDDGGGDFTFEYNYDLLDRPSNGIGWADDGGVTGTAVNASFATNQPARDTRFTCRFVDGLPTGCTSATITPEPATVALVAGGLLALAGVARRRRPADAA